MTVSTVKNVNVMNVITFLSAILSMIQIKTERNIDVVMSKDIIDRDTYKSIKKMNREELTKFILKYGDELLEQQGDKSSLDLSVLKERLSQINGIGNKRLEEIMMVIENFLDE